MALKPKIDVKHERIQVKVPTEVHEDVQAYVKFLGGDTTPDYVYVEAVKKEMRSDKAFQEARQANRGGAPAPRPDVAAPSSAAVRP